MTFASNTPKAKCQKPHKKTGDHKGSEPTGRSPVTRTKPGNNIRNASKPGKQFPVQATKQDQMLTLLSRSQGASLVELMTASGWQKHSVHGFLSGTVKKKLALELSSAISADGVRSYRIAPRFEK